MWAWDTSPSISLLLFSIPISCSFYLPHSSFLSFPYLPLIFLSHLYTSMVQVLDEASSRKQAPQPFTPQPVSLPSKARRKSTFTSDRDLVIPQEDFSADVHVVLHGETLGRLEVSLQKANENPNSKHEI